MMLDDLRNRARVMEGLADVFVGRPSAALAQEMAARCYRAVEQLEDVRRTIQWANFKYPLLQQEFDFEDKLDRVIDDLMIRD